MHDPPSPPGGEPATGIDTVAEASGGPRPDEPSRQLRPGHPPGTLIGRYVVVKQIARGGMGEVMLAYDTTLARNVALKIVLPSVASAESRERMLREAQAMARLSHPNVVGIYDAGVHDDEVFLAMEYVDGVTLRDWLKEPRSRREVLSVLKQAGRGLAAAHKADIVHRDFKPQNVIIARDGRVCVLDFGIARGVAPGKGSPASSRPEAPPSEPKGAALLEKTITLEGSVLGTPGYAAPEVMLGHEADPRADVFSFCVVLWKALYGSMPFPTELFAYANAVCGNEPLRLPPVKGPRWLHEVVVRGLERDPAARFASMEALLVALDASPVRRRATVLAGVLVALSVTGITLAELHHRAAVAAACRAEGDVIVTAWSAGSHEAARQAMLSETDAFAKERTDKTLERLDDYARAWTAEQSASCLATRVARTQSEAAHSNRSDCLLEGRMQLEIVVQTLASGDPGAHRHSLATVNSLPRPGLCAEVGGGRSLYWLPADPSARDRSLAGRRDVLRSEVLRVTGSLADAQKLAEHAISVAHDAGDGQLEARAEHALGKVLSKRYEIDGALQHERRAVARAEAVGADHLAGLAAADAAFLLDNRLQHHDEARSWLELAQGKLARVGGDEALELEVAVSQVALDQEHDPRRALEENARAIDLARRVDGELHAIYCDQIGNRGIIYDVLGDPAGAARAFRQEVDCDVNASGAHAPGLGLDYGNLADDQIALGQWDDAVASARHAAEVREAIDPKNPMLSWIYALEALALDGAHRYAEAEGMARRAVDLASENPSDMPLALFGLGLARAGQGDARGAKAACGQAAGLAEGPPKPEEPYYEDVLGCIGAAELSLGDVAAARKDLEQSVALPVRLSPGELAMSRFALARAYAASGPRGKPAADLDRARSLATDARDDLRGVVQTYPFRRPGLEQVERWLAQQEGRR
jgi:serine/threonine protein kinase/tetratricopeptide (TPR) repeat protein